MVSLFFGCVPKNSSIAVNFNKPNKSSQSFSTNVSSVQIINNQLIINGNGLADVINVKVDGDSFSELFSIESKSATKIIANSDRAFSFDVSKVFNVILSDANASATFPIDFSLCNATLNGKGFDCAAPVADKDVLSYDVASGKWKPRAVSGLNYLGAFNASSNPATGPATQPAGAYYIINASGSIAGIPFTTGDWLVSNGSAWQKIDNSTAVISVFGRNGTVTAQTGDYDLSMLGDISFPTAPVAGKVLKFDGTHWVAGDDLSGGGSGTVNTAEIADGAVTDAKIATLSTSKLTGTISSAQITDGTIVNADINAAAAIDYSKLNIPNTTIPYAKLNIADGDIPAAKISGLPTATLTGLSAGSGAIVAGDTILGAFGKMLTIQGDYVSKSTNTTVLGQITIDPTTGVLNVPNPASLTQATNKGWVENLVDSYGHWAKSGSNISFTTGNVGIGTASPGHPLSVNGIVESSSGGFKFPDGSVQTTAGMWNSVAATSQVTTFTAGTYSPQGQQGTHLTTPSSGSVDDGYYTINLPFPVNFNGTMYSTIYVGTNSYVTFGGGTTVYTSFSGSNPAFDKILVNSGDRSSNSVWYSSTPSSFSIRYEGGCTTSPGTDLVWELSGSSSNDKQMSLQVVSVCSGGYSIVGSPTTALHTHTPTAASAFLIDYATVMGSSAINFLAGDVGIGVGTPSAKLEVAGQVKITGGAPGLGKVLTSDGVGLASWQTPAVVGDNLGNHTATANIRLGSYYLSGDGDSEGIRVNADGNVGIGTSSQVGKLEVSGNAWGNYTTSASDSFYPFNAMSQGSSFIEITNANGGFSAPGSYLGLKTSVMNSPIQRAFIGIVGNSGATNYTPSIIFGQQTGPTAYQEKMRISPDGNVGIGTSGPTEKLVVFNGTTTGTYTTTGWMHSSDRRLKHGISSIEDSLNKILKLKGVEYIFNSDPENKKQLGFIAQDVEPIFPEVVGTDKKGFKSMVYSNLIAPLVESVKALYARIVGIEKHHQVLDRQIASKADKAVMDEKIRHLSNENEKLKKENSDIKAYLCSKDPSATICK